MPQLSVFPGHLKAAYDVVIVGSGYGGAVAASRLAGAGMKVCVLERGHEYGSGSFPGNPAQAFQQIQVDLPAMRLGRRSGLYDFRVNRDVTVLVGCGLGGTSLINGNVMVQPLPGVFKSAPWPGELRRNGRDLDAAFDAARIMLDGAPYPDPDFGFRVSGTNPARSARPRLGDARAASAATPYGFPLLHKLEALRRSAGGKHVELPLLAVSFKPHINEHGVQRQPCALCGDCVSGCNHAAKNSLDTNYLAHARRCGAELFCGARVRWIERRKRGDGSAADNGWNVWFSPEGLGRGNDGKPAETFVSARMVILAAGTLGSPEILFRSRARGGVIVSDRLGDGFSGNGDVIAFGYNNDPSRHRDGGRLVGRAVGRRTVNGVGRGNRRRAMLEPTGPTITGMIDERENGGMLIQEGAIPGALAPLLRWVAPLIARASGRDTDSGLGDRFRELGRELETMVFGARRGALANTQTYLVMSHEEGSGRIVSHDDRVRVRWSGVGHQPVFKRVQKRLRELTVKTGGTHVMNPIWTRVAGKRLLTVHPLGGCVMADDAGNGVVNHRGQVFCDRSGSRVYDDLLVLDGSIIPCPLGANPLWTIAALAERACTQLLEDLHRDNLGRCAKAPAASGLAKPLGIRFSERLKGHVHQGGPVGMLSPRFEARLVVEAADLRAFVGVSPVVTGGAARAALDNAHEATVIGYALAPSISPDPIAVTEGRFNLFVHDPDYVETRTMRYRLRLHTTDGRHFRLEGAKRLKGFAPARDSLTALFHLDFELSEEGLGGDRPAGGGRLCISVWELLRSIMLIRVTNARGLRDSIGGRFRFMRRFAAAVVEAVAWPIRSAQPIDPDVARPGSRLRLPVTRSGREVRPQTFRAQTDDGAQILLTRYAVGSKGPVMLAPGFGTSTLLFRISTIRPNLVEHLIDKDYDVWLLDYRASDRSSSSRTQFDLDDIVQYDLPRAVDVVCQKSGKGVQYVGHCVASVAMLMALLRGAFQGGV